MSSNPPLTTSNNQNTAIQSSKPKPFFDPSLFTQPRSKPAPPGAKTFLDLPIELRLIIYEYATADLFPYGPAPISTGSDDDLQTPDGAYPIPNLAIALANYRICTEHLMAAVEAEKRYWEGYYAPLKPPGVGLKGLRITLSDNCRGEHVLSTLGLDVVDRFDYILIGCRHGLTLGVYEPFGSPAPLGPRYEALEGDEWGGIRSMYAEVPETMRWSTQLPKKWVAKVERFTRKGVEAAGGLKAFGWEGEEEGFFRRAILEKLLLKHDLEVVEDLKWLPLGDVEILAKEKRRRERFERMEFSFVKRVGGGSTADVGAGDGRRRVAGA